MPSVADLIFIAVLSALIFTQLSVRLLGDAGTGWHIRTGQQILSTHTIPRVDPFSSTMAGKPWFAWEWLYDVLAGQLYTTAGLNGVAWLTAVIIAAVFSWMFRLLILRRTNLFLALTLVLLAMWSSTIHFLARPHVFSWLLVLAWFWILDSTEHESFSGLGGHRNRRLWMLPVLMLVWVNVHGGFLLGFVLLAVFLLGSLWTWFSTKEGRIEESLQKIAARKRIFELILLGLVSAAASLANPYGWKLYEHVYAYLSNRFLMDHIDEFQSPNFHGIAQRCFLVLLLIAVASLAARGRQLRLSNILLALFAVYAGLDASRNIPISAILLGMIVGPLFASVGHFERFSQEMSAIESRLRGHVWPILAILLTFLIAANGGRFGSNRLMDAHFDPKRMPEDAVSYLQSHEVQGPILSPDYWGGYLIYRFYPTVRVVVDDRHDLYGADFLKSYLRMIHVEQGWDEFLLEHDPRCVLLPRGTALTNILARTAGWSVLYSDQVSIAFVRDVSSLQKTNIGHASERPQE